MTVTHIRPRTADRAADLDTPTTVSSATLIRRAGITYRQLDYWSRTGLLTAQPGTRAGSGTWSYYDVAQVHRAATLRWLLDAGISLQTCRLVIDDLLETGSAHLADALVIHLPDDP